MGPPAPASERPGGPRAAGAGGSLTLLATTHRVAPGLLSWTAWSRLRESRVLTGSADHPQLPFLRAAGVEADVLTGDDVRELAQRLVAAAAEPADRPVLWLAAPEGDEELMRAIGELVVGLPDPPEVEVVHGSYDLPGARLLDVVTTMDTLRRECPWDRKQTHESLAPYLLEESYEALEAVETGDPEALCEELGDVLLQVAFHARVAEERTDGTGFTIDDVAAGIVDKLVRRHPHVFGSVEVSGSDEVSTNWDAIKAAERAAKAARKARRAEAAGKAGEAGGAPDRPDATGAGDAAATSPVSVLDGVPFGQPALALAAALQRRAARAGVPAEIFALTGAEVSDVAVELFAAVQRARERDLDPEAELRAAARWFRDRVRAWEAAATSALGEDASGPGEDASAPGEDTPGPG